jgi:uncharacterized ferredoxin-like protein
MILNERTDRSESVIAAARNMMTAARTAPKTKGTDYVEIAMVTDEDLERLSEKMKQIGEERGRMGMVRDADCILRGECVVLIGSKIRPQGLNCAHCGFPCCADKPDGVPCAFNAIDVGIALGSACATAADRRVDTRVMYSVGVAAQALGYLTDCKLVQGIALSASSKSPFFDRG